MVGRHKDVFCVPSRIPPNAAYALDAGYLLVPVAVVYQFLFYFFGYPGLRILTGGVWWLGLSYFAFLRFLVRCFGLFLFTSLGIQVLGCEWVKSDGWVYQFLLDYILFLYAITDSCLDSRVFFSCTISFAHQLLVANLSTYSLAL